MSDTATYVIPGALFLLWAALLFGGWLLGTPNADKTQRMPAWTRLASSFTLVIAAWAWSGMTDNGAHDYSFFIALGMTCGFAGDLCMAEIVPLPQPVIGGIAAFGLGHIFYIIAAITASNHLHIESGLRWLAWGIWLFIGAAGWYTVVGRQRPLSFESRAALPYALLLASTAGLATGLALQSSAFVPIAIGTALFLLSDLILAAQLFAGLRFAGIGDWVWFSYGPAQMLIVYSAASALLVLS